MNRTIGSDLRSKGKNARILTWVLLDVVLGVVKYAIIPERLMNNTVTAFAIRRLQLSTHHNSTTKG